MCFSTFHLMVRMSIGLTNQRHSSCSGVLPERWCFGVPTNVPACAAQSRQWSAHRFDTWSPSLFAPGSRLCFCQVAVMTFLMCWCVFQKSKIYLPCSEINLWVPSRTYPCPARCPAIWWSNTLASLPCARPVVPFAARNFVVTELL